MDGYWIDENTIQNGPESMRLYTLARWSRGGKEMASVAIHVVCHASARGHALPYTVISYINGSSWLDEYRQSSAVRASIPAYVREWVERYEPQLVKWESFFRTYHK